MEVTQQTWRTVKNLVSYTLHTHHPNLGMFGLTRFALVQLQGIPTHTDTLFEMLNNERKNLSGSM